MNNFNEDQYYNLAIKEYNNKNISKTKEILSNILKTNKKHFNSLLLIGTIFAQEKNFKKAEIFLNQALSKQPNNSELLNNIGNINFEIGNYNKAIIFFKKAIKFKDNFSQANYNLAMTYKELNNFFLAEKYYNKTIEINSQNIKAYNNLANIFVKQNRYEEALKNYEKIISINSKYANAFCGIANLYREIGNAKEAIKYYNHAIKLEPLNIAFHWLNMTLFPKIYKDSNELVEYKKRFKNNISIIESILNNENSFKKENILEALQTSTNFLLCYQAKNDKILQEKYSNLVTTLTNIAFPDKPKINAQIIKKPNNKIKVGFISSNLNFHSVSKTFKNWITKIDNKSFETSVFYIGTNNDAMISQIKKSSNNFFMHTNVEKIYQNIISDRLNLLIFLDIGMDPKTQILASMKLAPIQCCAWGHPSTSGFKNIDYFISNELMENESSKKYYSENLICLPGLGISYSKIKLPLFKKNEINKKNNKIIYLSNHSLFKLLPENDHIFFDIIKKNKNCEIHFFKGENEYLTSIFISRLKNLSFKKNIEFEKFFYFYERANYENYLKIINQSDIILDNIGFSGFNTGIEAINLNKPIVTLPGKLMKSKLVYAILKKIGLNELIAKSKKDYINIVLRLSNDPNFKESITKKINNNKKVLSKKNDIENFENFIKNSILPKN